MRRLAAFVLAAAAVAAACYPIEQPPSGVASVSAVLPPWPAVVVHDTMRDSTGAVAPLRALAFGTRGDTLSVAPTFVLLDSGAHLAGNLLVGDIFRGPSPVRVVGSLGVLQTPPQNVYVTVAPRVLRSTTKVDSLTRHTDTLLFVATPDTLSATNQVALTLTLVGGVGADTTVSGWVVTYRIQQAPSSKVGAPAVFVADNQQHLATADTTTTSGQTTRKVQLAYTRLADTTLALHAKVDSIVVVVTARYRGHDVSGSPARYVIPIRFKGF